MPAATALIAAPGGPAPGSAGSAAGRESGTARTFAPIAGNDQWLRCAHTDTALDTLAEEVTLAPAADAGIADPGAVWDVPAAPAVATGPAGLAFDPRGCLYHADPDRSQVQRVAWRPTDLVTAGVDPQPAVDLFAAAPSPPPGAAGEFRPVGPTPGVSVRAVALAADPDEHLFVLDGPTRAIHVLDLADGHLVRTIDPSELPIPPGGGAPPAPVDLAADGRTIVVATTDRTLPLVEVTALGLPVSVPVPAELAEVFAALPPAAQPTRVAVGPRGERWVLLRERTDPGELGRGAWAVPVADGRRRLPLAVTGAGDIELDGESRLVVAGPAGSEVLRRFTFTAQVDTEDPPLRARRYDGRGLIRTPEGAIGFWMRDVPPDVSGFRQAVVARSRYRPTGRVDGFGLDGGAYQQTWGRCFVEACIPDGAEVRVAFVTADDEPGPLEPEGPSIPRTLPANVTADAGPMPPAHPPLVALGRTADLARSYALHRRDTGRELPWSGVRADRFAVYEVPVHARPGRYLWVRLELSGTTAVTPRVRAVRVEVPGHDLLQRLPRAYRRALDAADFLRRYLGLADGMLTDMEARAARRDLVLDPYAAPVEVLGWLASLVGLVLDERWPERARRKMLAEAICLFRYRGTIRALRRMLEILLDTDVVIVELFRFRGVGGAFAGGEGEPEGTANAVVGFGFRVGGEVGAEDRSPLAGTAADAYRTHAHRFTVLVPRDLSEDQLATVLSLLDVHRPAHTLVEVCTVGQGMRVGVGLHLEISTLVGPSAGFHASVVGTAALGADTVLGKPRAGVRPGGSHLGPDLVVDP